ncbi:MAG: hypothetical protein V3V96_06615 [Acidiferrobacterales bacterium]
MKVFIYYNLTKHVWSIRAAEGPHKGLVIGHADRVSLRDCTFKVSEAGRQRVLKEKRKNVHAGIEGDLIAADGYKIAPGYQNVAAERLFVTVDRMAAWLRHNGDEVTYNPYKSQTFVTVDYAQDPVLYRNYVVMDAVGYPPVVLAGN